MDLLEEELVDLPGFAGPPPTTPEDLTPPAWETTPPSWSTPSPGDDEDDVDVEEGPRPASAPAAGASSRASTDWRDLLPIAATLVGMSSMLVRWVRGRRRLLAEGVWIADEDDVEAIAAPLARIANRHSPVGGKESADMADGLEVLVGTTGYAMKNLEREAMTALVDEPDPAA